ncbi:RNA polymerase sigma-70 factor [Prolixibacteraceae bacterium JC049]|nr:RNA polymerase sigma-70 factor [Prolixibacteraceae bacterium JC049]
MLEKERILIDHLKQGDEWAYEILFNEYAPRLTSYALSLVGDEDTAQEVVQDLFVDLYQKRSSLHIRNSIKTYLYIATRNNSIRLLRRKKKETTDLDQFEISSIDSFYSEIELVELREKLYEAIENLPTKTKEYFKMSRFNQLSYAEIAEEKGVSVKNVEYHISKAIKLLVGVLGVLVIFLFFFSKFI